MNILFIFADQMHRYAMHCMGNPDVQTPNLVRLASQGVLFSNAYSNCPICTPSRINLFTGFYTSQTQTFGNGARIPPQCHTLADALNEGGFRTSYVGKWHIGGGGNRPVPKELRGGFTDFIGYQCYNSFCRDVCFYDEIGTEMRFDGHRTDVTTDLAIDRLRQISDKSFALFVSYQAPHYPVQPGPEYEAMYKGVVIRRRPNCQDIDPYTRTHSPPSPWPPDSCPDFQRYGNNLDEYLRLYYALVTQVDNGVGRLLAELDRLGHRHDTAVVFTSDHGDMQGSHGLKNKCLPFEESSGIPLIVRVPDGASGVLNEGLVSMVDFFPTCLEWAGLPANEAIPGRSFASLVRGDHNVSKQPVFSEMQNWKMVRYRNLKLVVDGNAFSPTHLYDLVCDPYELTNLNGVPAHRDVVAMLRNMILRWQEMAANMDFGNS